MIDELNNAIAIYQGKWEQVVDSRQDKAFFKELKPTAVAWKTEDLADFDTRFAELRPLSDQIHLGWLNDRWLATFHLRDMTLAGTLQVVKLMQRRPGSSDATGLDHLDFHFDAAKYPSAKDILSAEPDLTWNEEINGEHCKWLSVWFGDEGTENGAPKSTVRTEAKIRSDTVVDVCIEELQDVRAAILPAAPLNGAGPDGVGSPGVQPNGHVL